MWYEYWYIRRPLFKTANEKQTNSCDSQTKSNIILFQCGKLR